MDIIAAHSQPHLPVVRELFQEYAASLPFSLCFQGFETELASLPGRYAPPAGRIFLAQDGPDAAGCIALRPLGPGLCEMKRLYIRPTHRARGLGRILTQHLIAEARSIGYEAMRLDTSADMHAAQRLYESLGFHRIDRYNDDPLEDTIFMELRL
jgi:putative acetyltransferase